MQGMKIKCICQYKWQKNKHCATIEIGKPTDLPD